MSKMKTSLYNQDGSLCTEAQTLLSIKPTDMSMGEWKKKIKELKVLLSIEDLKEFERLKKNSIAAKYRKGDQEKVKQINAKYYAKNPEKSKQCAAKWRVENPEKAKQHNVKWRAENPEHVASYINDYHKQRKAEDPLYRVQCNMRSMGNRVVKQLALGKKPASTEKWQGCSADELKDYFESLFQEGMTWDNYGEWHVDHIRPVCSFSAEEWQQINHYTNLQPLWAEDNYSKISADLLQIRV